MTPILWCARYGHDKVAKELLSYSDCPINAHGTDRQLTPLHLAAENGHLEILKALLSSRELLVDERDTSGVTALYSAVATSHFKEATLLLLEGGADPRKASDTDGKLIDIVCKSTEKDKYARGLLQHVIQRLGFKVDTYGRHGLHWAALASCSEALSTLMDGGQSEEVNTPDINGNTPLILAASAETNNIVKLITMQLLLTGNADPTACNNDKETVLHMCVSSNFREGVEILLDRNWPKYPSLILVIDDTDKDGYTALYRALVLAQDISVCRLLEAGADPELCPPGGLPMMHQALTQGNTQTVNMLIRKGLGVCGVSNGGKSSLHFACIHQEYDSVIALLQNGAQMSCDENGDTPLHLILRHKKETADNEVITSTSLFYNTVKTLIDACSDINSQNSDGQTPLVDAIKTGCDITVLKLLLNLGADHQVDRHGTSPLMQACLSSSSYRYQYVSLLLSSGACTAECDVIGNTAVHCFLSKSQVCTDEVKTSLRELINSGSNLNIFNSSGYSPLHIAVSNPHVSKDVIETLWNLTSNDTKNAQDKYGRGLLHLCLICFDDSTGKDLLGHKVENRTTDKKDKKGHRDECIGNILEVVKYITSEETICINTTNNNGDTPLVIAVKYGQIAIANMLIQQGADVHIINDNLRSLAHIAIDNKDKVMLTMLVKTTKLNKTDFDKRGPHGKPIDIAYSFDDPDYFGILCSAGTDVTDYITESKELIDYIMNGNITRARKLLWVVEDINAPIEYKKCSE